MRGMAVADQAPAGSAGRRAPVSELEFVGCRPVRVSADEIEGPEWEGRKVEYWHGASETAWMVREPTTAYHEGPASRLVGLAHRIGMARGSEVCCIGATDLRIRAENGTLGDIMQADQAGYLHPARADLSQHGQVIVGDDALPDVVLEVDNTTDVRRGKLVAYEDWRFPEVWVEVPERASRSRPPSLRSGLRIYLLEEGGYRESEESRAFPGWRTDEIHRALNEVTTSEATEAALWRVGRVLGEREGRVAEDDHLLRRVALENRARGSARLALSILRRRGIEALADRIAAAVRNASADAVAAAALTAEDETDFLARLG